MSSVLSKFHVLYFPENPENIHFFCSNKFQLVYIFQNIIKRRDISLMSVLLSKFPDISFTYNVLQNIMRREFQIISSISSKLQVLLFVFPECNTRSCISLMSAVLSSPVLLKKCDLKADLGLGSLLTGLTWLTGLSDYLLRR